jgi:hypothetical protein
MRGAIPRPAPTSLTVLRQRGLHGAPDRARTPAMRKPYRDMTPEERVKERARLRVYLEKRSEEERLRRAAKINKLSEELHPR